MIFLNEHKWVEYNESTRKWIFVPKVKLPFWRLKLVSVHVLQNQWREICDNLGFLLKSSVFFFLFAHIIYFNSWIHYTEIKQHSENKYTFFEWMPMKISVSKSKHETETGFSKFSVKQLSDFCYSLHTQYGAKILSGCTHPFQPQVIYLFGELHKEFYILEQLFYYHSVSHDKKN